jgi:hypothetical protein
MTVLLGAEPQPIDVRAPDQSFHDDTAPGGRAQELGHRPAAVVESLVRVTAPIGEQHQVAGAGRRH